MEFYAGKNMIKADGSLQKGDPLPLIESIRENIQARIAGINSRADDAIGVIDAEVSNAIGEFTKSRQSGFDDTVKTEGGRIRNLSSTMMKKQKLEGMESFIKRVMDDAVRSARSDPRYPDFLNRCVLSGLGNVKGRSATILVSEDDLEYSDGIQEIIRKQNTSVTTRVSADERVRSGGAMVIDDEAEVIYNNTVERIVYRRREEIRREIVRMLKENGAGKAGI